MTDEAARAFMRHGSCWCHAELTTTLFFAHPRTERDACYQAKEICFDCPVRMVCREHAIATREQWGVWGGMDEEERAMEIRRRDRVARRASLREAGSA